MQAILYDPSAPWGVRLGEAPEPEPGMHDVLVAVRAIALNFADVAFLPQRRKPGDVIGFEAAGVVLEAARDGSGPRAGARVTGFGPAGGWADRRALSVDHLAVVPDAVDFATAATVPVAGVTALRALHALGPVVGRRVLVTGASGGVGRIVVQLAARAGAHYGVLENVGGKLLAQAYELVEPGGWVQSIGMASLEPTSIDFERARLRGGGRIEAFNVFSHGGGFARDLEWLLDLVARGELDPQVGWRGPWTGIADAVAAFRARTVRGKAVLDVVH
jgi:NADPH:quinone reductase